MGKRDLGFLRTQPGDESFHRQRIMFCIKGNEIRIASRGTTQSHLEWFQGEGWLDEENAEEFLNQYIRGFYLPSENRIYAYRGVGFGFNEEVISEVKKRIPEFKVIFHLTDETKICFGPKDSPVHGMHYPRHCEGALREMLE